MFGFFNLLGRGEGLKALDQAFRAFDVHPRIVPEAVKIATVRLMQKASEPTYKLRDPDYERAAELLSYSILGPDQFVANTTLVRAELAEQRLEDAIADGDSLDAELLLLALNSAIIHPSVADQFDVESDE